MKTNSIFASFCLALSCGALLTAANVSVGDQPGVIRMTSGQQGQNPPAPVPSAPDSDSISGGEASMAPPLAPQPDYGPPSGVPMDQGMPGYPGAGPSYAQPMDYSPYFERSAGVTEAPVLGRRPQDNALFGPQVMFETNIGDGLGFNDSFHRANVRLPYHAVPGHSVLIGDLSASIDNRGQNRYNFGAVWRNFDASRNRIFGWNGYFDLDDGRGNQQWKRLGVGFESLGKYIDFRANGYFVTGSESALLSDQLIGDLALRGNSAFRIRNQTRDNAYSGVDFETGGPLPILGRRGINGYVGGYYLDSEYGDETVGFSSRVQALVTESVTANVNYTTDDTFGDNLWVGVSYTIPNYRERAIFQPRTVRERLADPVMRSSAIHSHIDVVNLPEAITNVAKGRAYNFVYVDPNVSGVGSGTYEDPYSSLQLAATNNNAGIDLIRIAPNADDSGTNLTVNGGLALYDCQVLLSSTKDYVLFTENNMDFVIPGESTTTGLGPLVSNPTMSAGGSVIRVSNENSIVGLRIDGANSTGTVFGRGIANPLPITDSRIVMNTFTNYTTAVDLQDASGDIVYDSNMVNGLTGLSESGLVLTTANGSMTNLLVNNNTVSGNSVAGINITAGPNSTLNADNPNGFAGVGVATLQPTGITNNTVTDGGNGIVVTAQAGSTADLLVEGNTSTGNTYNGFVAEADGSTVNLASLRNNTFSNNLENGAFLHYLNGGMFNAISEDLNGDGVLGAGEDLNGNGLLDEGIVSNNMNNNTIAGLCIFGEDNSVGNFDIGGPINTLGNNFLGNTGAGVAVDLKDTATAQIDALFNTISGGSAGPASLTIVLDFIDPGQAPVTDAFGVVINPFDVTNYGFVATDFDAVTNAVLGTVSSYFSSIPTVSQDSRSPIPDGMALDIDFVIGDNGVAPSNGATEYYVVNIGDANGAAGGGIANNIGNVRDANGVGPNPDLFGNPTVIGDDVAQVYADSLATFGPLNPATAFLGDLVPQPLGQAPAYAANALTSGNLTFTRRALGLVTSHEIGHTLSLRHVDDAGAITPTGQNPIMGTPAAPYLLPIQTLIEPAEFSFEANHLSEGPGDPQFIQFGIAQLASAVGLRAAGGPTDNGFTVSATDSAILRPSTFNNNTISAARSHGINIDMQGNAKAEGVTIQGNTIQNGGGVGVRLAANGPGASIEASNTIGGAGTNVYRGTSYAQGNTINGNAGDGFLALASGGGTINGNLINNQITNNGGNGASLHVDGSGTIDFGTPASNRLITGNSITGNGGAGIDLISTVTATGTGVINAVVRNNEISNNAGGGIVSQMFGPNSGGATNNLINLTVGGTSAQTNDITGNGNVGISYSVAGNAKGVFTLSNSTISGTTNGADPLTFGDGIYLNRADSSLLLADISNVTSINNAGNGMLVTTQGNDKNDPNQPMSGTINSVDWNNSIFDNNGLNGVAFRTRGDSMLVADGQGNFTRGNAENGIDIETYDNSSFGDSSDGLPPGRRTIFDGFVSTGNGLDGLLMTAQSGSQLLLEVTSTRVATTSGAHAALNTNGNSSYSSNGSDGIHIDNFGSSFVDVKITSEGPVTADTGRTFIQDNGTVTGAFGGIFIASANTGTGVVNVTNTIISGNLAAGTEDTNGNGILDPGEDLNGNDDIDVFGGDGIAYNAFNRSSLALQVGGTNEGNIIQNNADDGIAITAVGSGTDISRPIISITGNQIGGLNNGVAAGNGGDGVSLNVIGGTDDVASIGSDPGSIDTDIGDGDGLSFSNGVTQSGPIVQMALNGNSISHNDQRGVNLLLNGAAGERDREFGASFFDPVRITLIDNTIASNGTEGVYYRADSDMNQGRLTYLANFPFPNPPFNPADSRPQIPFFYDPTQPEFQNDNVGSVNGNTAFLGSAPDGALGFLNLRTVQNSFLTMTGNTVQNNGTGTVTGEGLVISVGTGAYVAADVRNNIFGGNLQEDVRTESFLSAGNTYDSVDDTGATNFDAIYHDDTAQLDMRFTNNSGNQVLFSSTGATFTNNDALKRIVLGAIGVTDRDAGLFQIDDGANLNNPNNTFINFGLTQSISGSFATGGYNIRGAADPMFPNIGFAPFLP